MGLRFSLGIMLEWNFIFRLLCHLRLCALVFNFSFLEHIVVELLPLDIAGNVTDVMILPSY